MKLLLGLLIGLVAGGVAFPAPAAPLLLTLHVAPNGDDQWTGRLAAPNASATDGPLASIARARDLIRGLTAPRGPVVVEIAAGVYPLSAPLVFAPEDSGAPGADIIYRAAAGARPIFSGGVPVIGWQQASAGIWTAHLPEKLSSLWMNGRRLPRARFPATGTVGMTSATETGWQNSQRRLHPAYGMGYDRSQVVVGFDEPEMVRAVSSLGAEDLRNTTLVVYDKWNVTRRWLDSAGLSGRSVTVHGQGFDPWTKWGAKSRFLLENVPAGWAAPGTWTQGSQGDLSYRSLPGERGPPQGVVAPRLEKFIVLEGDPAGRTVNHLIFKGLTFAYAGWTMPSSGVDPVQAAADTSAVILADGAHDIRFSQCAVEHIATNALWFRRGCHDIVVQQCRLEDLGAGGVRIGEPEFRTASAEQTGRIAVDNCIIRHAGRQFENAEGVWIGQSSDNRITHNEIADLYYTGVSVGWVWGYGPSGSARNEISYNRIHHLGQELLSDMGGIYTLGKSPGTVCAHNVIYDVTCADYGGYGLYLDEGSSHVIMRDNLVYRAESGGLHQTKGEANLVENNILADGTMRELAFNNPEDHLSLIFEHNIVYWSHGPLFPPAWAQAEMLRTENLYYRTGPVPADFDGRSLAAWEAGGGESDSLVADPRFVNPSADDFRLRPDSPAFKLGFVPFDPAEAGVYGDPAWIALACQR